MNGAEARELRERYGLKRPEICEMSEGVLTVAKLAGIELGRQIRPDELRVLEDIFGRLATDRPYTTKAATEKSRESPKLVDKKQPSDPLLFTSANPSIDGKLNDLAGKLKGGRKRKAYVVPVNTRFVKANFWNGIQTGDMVYILSDTVDEPGKANWLKGSYEFLHHVTDTVSGASWVDVKGGKSGHVLRRSFADDRVHSRKRRS